MRNLIQFLIRHNAFFLFALLEILSLAMVLHFNRYQHAAYINSANYITGNAYKKYAGLNSYLDLQRVNDSLIAENARLLAYKPSSIKIDTVTEVCIEDSLIRQLYTYIPARVINNEISGRHNFLTLDKGARHGITRDMGVISSQGIVGKVVAVSENFSVVMSVLNTSFSVRAAIAKNNVHGSLHWDAQSPDRAILSDISRHVRLHSGDLIQTTGFSSVFPEAVPVGTVSEVKPLEGSNFLEVTVNLATDFRSLKYTYVVNYLQKDERSALENSQELE